jgi:hypothetical protein
MSTNDAKKDDIWAVLERGARYANSLPQWMLADFNVNPVNFTTYSEDGSGPPSVARVEAADERK